MFLKNITYTSCIEFEVTRQDHLKRKVNVLVGTSPRDKGREYKYFELIPEGFSINFDDITIIVGDNGTGKSTLLKTLKLPDFSYGNPEKLMKSYIKDKERTLTFSKMPKGVMLLNDLHKGSVRSDIGKKIDADAYSGKLDKDMFVNHFFSADDSNGECLLDVYKQLDDFEDTVIILDEPETSLSLKSVKLLMDRIINLKSKNNQIIISTHHPSIMKLCNTVFDMESKTIINTNEYLQSVGI